MITYAIAFSAITLGFLTSISPCLFPILPTYVAYLSNSKNGRYINLVFAFLVTLGILSVFLFVGLVYSSIIGFFSSNYENSQIIQGIVLVILGGLILVNYTISFEGLNKLSDFSNRIINRYENNFLISYFIGLSFTMLAAPCAIIYFGTVFTLVPNSSMMISILLLTLYSFGAGLPFFMVSGIFPIIQDLLISKRNNIRNYVSIFSGILIIITGLIQFFDGLNLIELNYL